MKQRPRQLGTLIDAQRKFKFRERRELTKLIVKKGLRKYFFNNPHGVFSMNAYRSVIDPESTIEVRFLRMKRTAIFLESLGRSLRIHFAYVLNLTVSSCTVTFRDKPTFITNFAV